MGPHLERWDVGGKGAEQLLLGPKGGRQREGGRRAEGGRGSPPCVQQPEGKDWSGLGKDRSSCPFTGTTQCPVPRKEVPVGERAAATGA